MSKNTITEIPLGSFIVKDDIITYFILKSDGLVYLRSYGGHEEEPITVKQFMAGITRVQGMFDEWKKETDN